MDLSFRCCVFTFIVSLLTVAVLSTPLDDYVNAPDSTYDYTVLEDYTRQVDGEYIVYILNMTSQKWLDEKRVSRSIWWHYLAVTIPDKINYLDVGLLYITGSNNNNDPPDPLENGDILLASLAAVDVGIVTGCLFQVPNQPIVFSEDPKNKSRSEDAIIAYTWNHYLNNGTDQPDYLALLPMTKAGIRALDTMKDWSHKIRPEVNLTRFFPTGGSKAYVTLRKDCTGKVPMKLVCNMKEENGIPLMRGWTAWLMGAVDKRVFAMAPIVLDVLNAIENLRHHFRSLNGWTWAFNPYYEEGITSDLDHPDAKTLEQIIDPFAYRDRLTMPKYIITASNDEFFLVDDSHYYLDQMMGPTFVRIVANAEHTMIGHRENIWNSIASFVVAVLENYQMPKLSWERYENNTHAVIVLTTDTTPIDIKVWHSNSLPDARRDWRLLVSSEPGSSSPVPHLAFYRSYAVRNTTSGEYWAEFHRPYELWECFFIEASFPGPNGRVLVFTTEVNVTPDGSFAAPNCYGAECTGDLI